MRVFVLHGAAPPLFVAGVPAPMLGQGGGQILSGIGDETGQDQAATRRGDDKGGQSKGPREGIGVAAGELDAVQRQVIDVVYEDSVPHNQLVAVQPVAQLVKAGGQVPQIAGKKEGQPATGDDDPYDIFIIKEQRRHKGGRRGDKRQVNAPHAQERGLGSYGEHSHNTLLSDTPFV